MCDVQGGSPTVEGGIDNAVEELSASQSQKVGFIYNFLKLVFVGDLKALAPYEVVQCIKGICEEVEYSFEMVRSHYHERGKKY